MIKLLPRTESAAGSTRSVWIQCDIDRHEDEGYGTASCPFCRYASQITSFSKFIECRDKHACSGGSQPWIQFQLSKDVNIYDPTTGDPYPDKYYDPTSVDRQVEFEGMPYKARLCLAHGLDAKCNADCWWHGWRLDNKKTWRQCGKSHLCGNNGSFWNLLVPVNATLRQELFNQM